MADSYHHSLSSVRKWGGAVDDYRPIHDWFDATKAHFADPRHRALRHHSEGIALMITIFGPTLTTSDGRTIPTRWIGEQHVMEDFGHIPTAADFLRLMTVEPWMVKGARRLSRELETV
jgi:hypothetical protein